MKRKPSLIFTILTALPLLCGCGSTTAATQGTDAQQADAAAELAAHSFWFAPAPEWFFNVLK